MMFEKLNGLFLPIRYMAPDNGAVLAAHHSVLNAVTITPVYCTSRTLTVYDSETNSYTDTQSSNDTKHQIVESKNATPGFDMYYEWNSGLTASTAATFYMEGYTDIVAGLAVQYYDWNSPGWVAFSFSPIATLAADTTYNGAIPAAGVSGSGVVRVRFYEAGKGGNNRTLYVDHMYVYQ